MSLVSISSCATAIASPIAFMPKARRGVSIKEWAKTLALSGPSTIVQGTTTSCEPTVPHST
jgi:hypothetical protein